MAFISKTTLLVRENELLRAQVRHLEHHCREQQAHIALLKQNEHNREKIVGYEDYMIVNEDAKGRMIRETSKTVRTIVEPEEESLAEHLDSGPFGQWKCEQ